jgi:N-terminal domain of reverse transcriptase
MDPGTEGQVGHLMVNGPEDDVTGWLSIDWQRAEDDVRRLRQRIFTATQAGDLARVRNLQKLTAPRGALSYPRLSWEEFEGRFLGLMPYLELKGEGNHSMAGN